MPLDGVRTKSRPKAAQQPAETTLNEAKENEAAAWEYYTASVELRAAEVRRTRAQATMVRLGLMPDHIANPYPPGTSMVVYADGRIAVSVLVLDPIVGMDLAGLEKTILKAGIRPALVKKWWKANRTEARPAHRFTASLVSSA